MRRRPAAAPEVLRRPAAAPEVQRRPAGVLPLAAPEATGPVQLRDGSTGTARRQYCWWITFPFPYEDTVTRLGLITPNDFTRESFLEACKVAHTAAGVDVVEGAVFLEKHVRTDSAGQRLPHLNALVRAGVQFAWRGVGKKLFDLYKIRVDFAGNIRTWVDGVIYGFSPSEHKPREELDADYIQWSANGSPMPLEEVLPLRLRSGAARETRLTPLQVYDMCTRQGVKDVESAWALAKAMEAEGDRGLLAWLFECRDVEGFVGKIRMANESAEAKRRENLGRLGLLREAAQQTCTCDTPGQWLQLARETLQRNGILGSFQKALYESLDRGREKKTNLFLLGPTDAAKSFLLKPLTLLFRCYTQPDGGTHQLETLLGQELVYLNDFTWDEKWLGWAYLKTFMGGDHVSVARPKNRGGNVEFTRDSPIIGTCCAPIQLFVRVHGNHFALHQAETDQMNARVTYIKMDIPVPPDAIVKCKACAKCGAVLYLEGGVPEAVPAQRLDRSRSRERRPPQ